LSLGLLESEVGLSLHASVHADMVQRRSARRKHATNQHAAVTASRILLAAHYRDTMGLHLRFKPGESSLERLRLGESLIHHMAFGIIEIPVVGVPTEFPSQKDVLASG